MATEYLYPNGNDGGWDVSNHANCNEGINGPGLDDDSDGPVEATHIDETTDGDAVVLDLSATAITDADTVTAVDIRIRGQTTGFGNDRVDIDWLIGGIAQGTTFNTGYIGSTWTTHTATGSVQGWNSDWSASQLNGAQVRLTTTQTGKAETMGMQVCEVEVEITYTEATDELTAQGVMVMQ